jgi:hypothetical protein
MAEHVLALLADPGVAHRMGEAANRRADLFDLPATLAALGDAVSRVISRNAKVAV